MSTKVSGNSMGPACRKSKPIDVSIISPNMDGRLDGRNNNLVDMVDRLGDILRECNESLTDKTVGDALRGLSACSEGLNAIAESIDNLANAIRDLKQ